MTADCAELPEYPDQLRAFARSLQAELYAKTLHIEKLKAQLAALRRARYGRSSEKLEDRSNRSNCLWSILKAMMRLTCTRSRQSRQL